MDLPAHGLALIVLRLAKIFSPAVITTVLLLTFWICLDTAVQAQSFGNVAMGGGGYVTGIIPCSNQQNLFYAKTDVGGAYRWDEPTQSWIPLLDWLSQNQVSYMGVESIAVDPQSPGTLYILAGTSYWNNGITAILRSTNYGTNFTITDVTSKFKANGNGSDRNKGESLSVDPNLRSIIFCGSRANGLFKSTDSGTTWNVVSSLNVGTSSISFVKFDPVSGTPGTATPRIFVGVFATGTNLYVSNDAGNTWTALTNSPAASLPERCALASDRNLYITYGNDPNGAIMKYNITNGVWTNCSPSGTLTYCGISVCATNPNKLVASTYSEWKYQPWGPYGDRIYVSTNGGATWNDLLGNSKATNNVNGFPYIQPAAVHWAGSIEMDPFNSDRVFVGSGNGIFCTTNLNSGTTLSTWKFMVKGLEETVPINFISVPGGPFITSVGDQGGFVNTNITVAAPTNISQSTSFAYAAQKTNFIARVVSNGELYYSKQLPVTWTKCPSTPGVMTNGSVAIAADGSILLWKSVVGGVQTCYTTTNFGTNWTLSSGLAFSSNPKADAQNPLKFYAYNSSDGYLYASTNGGLAFVKGGLAGTGGSSTFCTAPGFEGHVWIAMNGGGLKYSTNSGASFLSENVTEADAIAFGKTAPGATYPTLFIYGRPAGSSFIGMYRSTDKAATWVSVNDTNHQYGGRGNAGIIEGDKNVCGRVYMSSVGRGVPYMDSWVSVTNVTVSPVTYSLPVNGTVQLTASVGPANSSNPALTWGSSNAAVAAVSVAGLVAGRAAGTSVITATTVDGSYVAGCVLTVTNVLPPPWLAADVGTVATNGYVIYNPTNDTFAVAGSGAGITNSADEFYYVYQPMTTNVTITGRIVSLSNTDPSAMSGLMIRQSLTASSAFVSLGITYGSGSLFQNRLLTGGSCASTAGLGVTYPYWVRLVKLGDTITGYLSADGNVWLKQGAATCPLTGTFYVGTPVTSHNDGVLCTSSIAGVVVSAPQSAVLNLFQNSSTTFVLSWPVDHLGWILQSNSSSLMNTDTWFNVAGSDLTNQIVIPISPSSTNVFYRMKY